MKSLFLIMLTFLSLTAHAQFRSAIRQASGTLITPAIDGSGNCVIGHTTNGFTIQSGDANNPLNTQQMGLAVCRLMGTIPTPTGFTALPGGNWRHTTADVDPATTCRFEGTPSVAGLTGISCGVDP